MGKSSNISDGVQSAAYCADNLVDDFENVIAAYLWLDRATDKVDQFHAEENLMYSKKRLAQRLRKAMSHTEPVKNAKEEL